MRGEEQWAVGSGQCAARLK